jgi:hypothetical protein
LPEDPWQAFCDIPLTDKITGEQYTLTASSKLALAAVKDLLATSRSLPRDHLPVIKLGVVTYQGKFGKGKKPTFIRVGKQPVAAEEEKLPFNDSVGF